MAKNSKLNHKLQRATPCSSLLLNLYNNHSLKPLIFSDFWPPRGMPSTLKHQWVFIGQVLGGRLQKISKKQTLEPLLCLLVRQRQASVPKHQHILPNRHICLFLHKSGLGTEANASVGPFGRNVPFM